MTADDAKYLELLAVFHYVFGGLLALFSCFPILHVVMGLALATGRMPMQSEGAHPPESLFGWIFVIMGSLFVLTGWMTAIAVLIAGRRLQRRQNRLFCMVVAGIECMFMPFGTALGVFTLILLNKDPVKSAFEQTT